MLWQRGKAYSQDLRDRGGLGHAAGSRQCCSSAALMFPDPYLCCRHDDRNCHAGRRRFLGSLARWLGVHDASTRVAFGVPGLLPVTSARSQRDLPYRATGRALDARQQFRPPCPAAAAVVAHLRDDVAYRQVVPPHVRLVDHLQLAAAIAFNTQEPRGERAEGLVQASAPEGSGSMP